MVQPYVVVEDSGCLYISPGDAPPLLVARVVRVPHLDTWMDLVERNVMDETVPYPFYAAALEAVRRWGGRVEIQPPKGEA